MGRYEGEAEVEGRSFTGKSKKSFEDALEAAVDASGAPENTVFTVSLAVVTVDDPKIGEYRATITHA